MNAGAALSAGPTRRSAQVASVERAPLRVTPSPVLVQRKGGCACGGHCPRCAAAKASMPVGSAHDPLEAEADRIADHVLGMPDSTGMHGESMASGAGRLPSDGTARAQAKRAPEAAAAPPAADPALGGAGAAMSGALRAYFEPRFGRDFSGVRLHTHDAAAKAAQAMAARAFTVGDDIAFAAGEYRPDSPDGRRLLAHELAHVAQQRASSAPAPARRQTMGAGCAARQPAIEAAWAEGLRLTEETIASLEHVLEAINLDSPPSPIVTTALRNNFGDVGLEPGGLTFLPELIRRYRSILGGFRSGKTLRCDPESLSTEQNECSWRSAFVIVGDSTNIFLCPQMFESDVTTTSRGVTLLHEMAHSTLRIAHAGIPERTYPSAFFDCATSLELDWEDAKRNAFAFDRLANCLHGDRPSAALEPAPTVPGTTAPATTDPRWSISAQAGAEVTPNAYRFASALSGRVSLRTGEYVVFNPVIGLNLLYLPPSDFNPTHLAAAAADIGLRIQQPLEGFYFDVTAGGYAGFDIDPARASPAALTGGVTASTGLGWRFQRLEIGAEARALVPEAEFDRTQVLIFGRAALRFP